LDLSAAALLINATELAGKLQFNGAAFIEAATSSPGEIGQLQIEVHPFFGLKVAFGPEADGCLKRFEPVAFGSPG
jgi:hypothetical protein